MLDWINENLDQEENGEFRIIVGDVIKLPNQKGDSEALLVETILVHIQRRYHAVKSLRLSLSAHVIPDNEFRDLSGSIASWLWFPAKQNMIVGQLGERSSFFLTNLRALPTQFNPGVITLEDSFFGETLVVSRVADNRIHEKGYYTQAIYRHDGSLAFQIGFHDFPGDPINARDGLILLIASIRGHVA